MDEYLEANRQLWDSWTRVNLKSSLYDVEGFASKAVEVLHRLPLH